jgi:hypothetical protein
MAQAVSYWSDAIGERTQVLTLEGDCDLSTAVEAEQRIVAALDDGRTEIVFDLRGVRNGLGRAFSTYPDLKDALAPAPQPVPEPTP